MHGCERLNQREADRWLKEIFDLHGEDVFRSVFCDEANNIKKRYCITVKNGIWALPLSSRDYYLGSIDNVAVLFVGVDWGNLNGSIGTIASLAKVKGDAHKSIDCFKRLMVDVLYGEAGKRNKIHISAMARTKAGEIFFNRLRKNLPDGFQDESLSQECSFVFKVVQLRG